MTPTRDRNAWIFGANTPCRQPPAAVPHPWRLVLIGPPGVGKGTQAELLESALGACTLSTGELFRAASLGLLAHHAPTAAAHACMHRGGLVDDDTVLSLIRERRHCLRCSGGFMLDGFPRTVAQAAALDELLAAEQCPLDAAINYELPPAYVVERLSGRRHCPHCRITYHVTFHRPLVDGLCDRCRGPLVQRRDDSPAAIQTRLTAFNTVTVPVIDYYRTHGLLVSVNASGDPVDVLARTLDALAALRTPAHA
jgi:adenylate kinases